MNVGSLFAGIGGIELGLERAGGFKPAWFVEWEPYAQAVLRKHWPGVPVYGDIREIDFRAVAPVDVLTGGFPCQDISNAGKRKGIQEGTRSVLWKEYLRAIRELRPRWVIVENVAALLIRGIGIVLGDLAAIGYDAEWYCIPASSVGAPHRRDRIFIIAYPNDGRPSDALQPGRNAAAFSGDDVAHPYDGGCVHGSLEEQPAERRKQALSLSRSCRDANIPNAERERCGEWEQEQARINDGCGIEVGNWWAVEPDVGRVAYGVPSRVDRIKCLGNAVVPQVAEIIGQAINLGEEVKR